MSNTIIFGPTGHVGSATTRAAQQYGAKVFLAMRNPEKRIPHLSVEQEQAAGFERIQADLTKPDTIRAAVTKTGAKNAFIYVVFGTADNMRSSIEALKSAGIEFVVLLSSIAVQGESIDDLKSIPPSKFVGYAHAQVEISLAEIFGPRGFVAVRPGYFATNSMQWKTMITAGEVKILYPDAKFDWISPEDIGRVCGILAAGGSQAAREQNAISLYGPELISLRDAVAIMGSVFGKDIKVTELDEQDGLEAMKVSGIPEPVAKYLVKVLRRKMGLEESDELSDDQMHEKARDNILKYSGKMPTRFEQWTAENKHEFNILE
jgi:uncharacterized protein YbjT (DUF2867 family)